MSFLAIIFLTSSFQHHMSPRSPPDFFPHTSTHAFRTPFLKVFHKSGASVHTGSFTLYSNLTLIWFSFNFHILPFTIRSFVTIFFITFFYSDLQPPVCAGVPMESLLYSNIFFVFFPLKHNINFTFIRTLSDFPFLL